MTKHARHRNEFFAAGLPADESAVDLAIKAELAASVARFLLVEKMSQSDAAQAFGVPQPVISKIVTGNLEKLSLSYLWRLLFRMGQPVRAQTGKHPDETRVSVGAATVYTMAPPPATLTAVDRRPALAAVVTMTGSGTVFVGDRNG